MLAVSERGNEHILGSPGRERQGLFLRKGSTARGTANSVKAAVVVNDALSRAALQCCSVLAGSGSLPARSARLQRLICREQIPKSLASIRGGNSPSPGSAGLRPKPRSLVPGQLSPAHASHSPPCAASLLPQRQSPHPTSSSHPAGGPRL